MHDRLAAVFLVCTSILLSLPSLTPRKIGARGRVIGEPLGEACRRGSVEAQHERRGYGQHQERRQSRHPRISPGQYTLRLNALGIGSFTVEFSLAADEAAPEFGHYACAPTNRRRKSRSER